MIKKIKNFINSYNELSRSIRFEEYPNGDYPITDVRDAVNLTIAYNHLTSTDQAIEPDDLVSAIEELIEKENDIRDFFEKNNNPLKENFYTFYQAYLDLQDDKKTDSKVNKTPFKNFLFSLYEQGN